MWGAQILLAGFGKQALDFAAATHNYFVTKRS
jgi:hypothetical protein